MMIPPPIPAVNLLDRKTHLAAQLDRNRLYLASLHQTTIGPWPPSPDEIAAEIARVAEVIRLIEADLSLLPFAPPPADEAPALPRCSRCGQPFPLIQMSVYPTGLLCPGCDRARAADSEGSR